MDEVTARALIGAHFEAAGRDEVRATEIYAEDAVIEFPQGGERIRGNAHILAFRSAYPRQVEVKIRRTLGCGDVWVNEGTISYDGAPSHDVSIMEFRGGKVVRETIYVGESWEPPAWRAQWVEPIDPHTDPGRVDVAEPNSRSVFAAFLKAANTGDFKALDGLIHPDYVETYAQSGERTHGVANLQAIIENYPGGYKDLG